MEQGKEYQKISYLPNGSVVVLAGGSFRVMICGRQVQNPEDQKRYDYMGYRYPQGFQNPGDEIFFFHDQIDMTFFLGFQDMEELIYRQVLHMPLQTESEEVALLEGGKEV